jgi:LmbE family N-acetylglucosaminyl deacetylase
VSARTLLGVWAHPDDEAYLSAGLMAHARGRGDRVVVVTATAGELGTDDADRWPPHRLAAERRRELRAALAAVDVTEHHVLGYRDGACQDDDGSARIAEIVDRVQPDTIVTFGPDGMTGHPDHRAVSDWTTAAWHTTGCRARLWYATLTPSFHDRWSVLNERVGMWT